MQGTKTELQQCERCHRWVPEDDLSSVEIEKQTFMEPAVYEDWCSKCWTATTPDPVAHWVENIYIPQLTALMEAQP